MNIGKISVIVTCRDEAGRIEKCLDSAHGFGECIVVDSFSGDDTVALARERSSLVYQRPFVSAADQKNWALQRVRYEWVLILDADEILTRALRAEIEELQPTCRGYWIRRRSDYLGRTIRGCGWQRDRVLRLFERAHGRYDDAQVHEEVHVVGKSGALRNPLEHHPYRDVTHHIKKINEYSSRGARDFVERGGRMAALRMLTRPPLRFVRMYLLQAGFRDGWQGLVLCLLSVYSVFLKYAKAWELQWRDQERES